MIYHYNPRRPEPAWPSTLIKVIGCGLLVLLASYGPEWLL